MVNSKKPTVDSPQQEVKVEVRGESMRQKVESKKVEIEIETVSGETITHPHTNP
jgi:hypothetical protein